MYNDRPSIALLVQTTNFPNDASGDFYGKYFATTLANIIPSSYATYKSCVVWDATFAIIRSVRCVLYELKRRWPPRGGGKPCYQSHWLTGRKTSIPLPFFFLALIERCCDEIGLGKCGQEFIKIYVRSASKQNWVNVYDFWCGSSTFGSVPGYGWLWWDKNVL